MSTALAVSMPVAAASAAEPATSPVAADAPAPAAESPAVSERESPRRTATATASPDRDRGSIFGRIWGLVRRLFGGRDATPPPATTTTTSAPTPTTTIPPLPDDASYVQIAEHTQAHSPDTRPWFCNAVGDGTPLGGHGNGNHVHDVYEGMTKGPLSWDDCLTIAEQFDAALASTEGLETRGAAEAAGWRVLAPYIPGLGTHHGKGFAGLFNGGPVDVAAPTLLIYGGDGPEAPLVGVSYVGIGGEEPPEAFAGDNDWWHLHQKICMGEGMEILAGAEEIPDEECAALGGTQRDLGPGIWLLHLWIVPDYELKLDAFASGHPCLGETGPLPDEDPCWDLAFRDPSEGLPPGMEEPGHGDGDGHGHETPTPEVPVTTVPAPVTTVPAPTTTVPAPTTTVPAPTTTVPAPTTTVPAPTTTVPAPTTTVPAPTTTVPDDGHGHDDGHAH